MRSWSRLMAGGVLGEGARLLEHTLALVGDTVDPGVIWQGWPVKTMLATSEFWRLRRNQIKLGRKQLLRRIHTIGHAGVKDALSKVEVLSQQNRGLQRSITELEVKLAQVPERGTKTEGGSSRQGGATVAVDAPAAMMGLVEKVEWLLEEVRSLRAWRETVAACATPRLPLLAAMTSTSADSLELGISMEEAESDEVKLTGAIGSARGRSNSTQLSVLGTLRNSVVARYSGIQVERQDADGDTGQVAEVMQEINTVRMQRESGASPAP